MVDVDPRALQSTYTPRESTMVDALAEARRIADQAMRNNPLVNAVIERGLTRFRGNYGDDFIWFGEFFPADKNLTDDFGNPMPQRGISITRDDPTHNQVFALYDFDQRPGEQLRQRIYMRDADGQSLMLEGFNGGRAFPDTPIVMYQRESFENPAANWTSDRIIYSGEGNLTGTRLEFSAAYTVSAAGTISNFLRCSGGGVTINTPTQALTGNQNVFLSVDVKTILNVSDYINVEWHMWNSAGVATAFVPRVYKCRAYSPFTRP